MSLGDLGLRESSSCVLMKVAESACTITESIHNESFSVTPRMLLDALRAADEYVKEFRAAYNRS